MGKHTIIWVFLLLVGLYAVVRNKALAETELERTRQAKQLLRISSKDESDREHLKLYRVVIIFVGLFFIFLAGGVLSGILHAKP